MYDCEIVDMLPICSFFDKTTIQSITIFTVIKYILFFGVIMLHSKKRINKEKHKSIKLHLDNFFNKYFQFKYKT